MEVNITGWALDSYMDLKAKVIFTTEEYKTILRPDVELLKEGFPPKNEKFRSSSFWGPAKDLGGKIIKGAYKMKWHNLGPGRIQLRLLVAIYENEVWLCDAYVKSSNKIDQRFMAKMKIRMRDLANDNFILRGRL